MKMDELVENRRKIKRLLAIMNRGNSAKAEREIVTDALRRVEQEILSIIEGGYQGPLITLPIDGKK